MDNKTVLARYGLAPLPEQPAEAMAYVPFQPESPKLCKPALGYESGTLFTALKKPFYGGKCRGDADD